MNKKAIFKLVLLGSISLFLFGIIILHVIFNDVIIFFRFFGFEIHKSAIFDIGLLIIGIAYMIILYIAIDINKSEGKK